MSSLLGPFLLDLSERLRRLIHGQTGFASVSLPDGSVLMARCGGRDQVLEQVLRAGWEDFERPLPRVFRDAVLGNSGLIVDVGANTGLYSLIAGRCGRAVMAFEPVPAIREIFRRNVAANRLERAISVMSAALSDRDGAGTLFLPDPSHGLIETSASLDAAFQAYAYTMTVMTTSLDALVDAATRVAVIKIDAEGHEAAVLRGAAGVIERDRPVLFVEVLPRAEMGYLNKLLLRLGYVDVPLIPNAPLAVATEVQFVPDAWNHAFLPRERGFATLGMG